MRLEIGSIFIKDVQFADATSVQNGVLYVNQQELAGIAGKHGLKTVSLQAFVDGIMQRMVFDGEQLSDLLAPLGFGWKARVEKELALMNDLIPLLRKLAQGRDISGLGAYEQ